MQIASFSMLVGFMATYGATFFSNIDARASNIYEGKFKAILDAREK